MRAFFDNAAETKPFRIQSVPLAAGLPYLIDTAEDIARRAANQPKRIVFCPPLGAFSNPNQAREQDLVRASCSRSSATSAPGRRWRRWRRS